MLGVSPVIFTIYFSFSITRAGTSESNSLITQALDRVEKTNAPDAFDVAPMTTWGELVDLLNKTQRGDLYTPEMSPFITCLAGAADSNQFSYIINADHPEYASQPAICSITAARRYCNYKEVSLWLERQLTRIFHIKTKK
jgi:hypothetical protein